MKFWRAEGQRSLQAGGKVQQIMMSESDVAINDGLPLEARGSTVRLDFSGN
jgi:hypothetical protein